MWARVLHILRPSGSFFFRTFYLTLPLQPLPTTICKSNIFYSQYYINLFLYLFFSFSLSDWFTCQQYTTWGYWNILPPYGMFLCLMLLKHFELKETISHLLTCNNSHHLLGCYAASINFSFNSFLRALRFSNLICKAKSLTTFL